MAGAEQKARHAVWFLRRLPGGLAAPRLTQLLRARPEVGLELVPRGFEQLAQGLGGADSPATALRTVSRDTITVGQAVAALGSSGDRPGGAPPPW